MSTCDRCLTCKRVLNVPDDPTTKDCGGDCMRCMAWAGDTDCIEELRRLGYNDPEWPTDA